MQDVFKLDIYDVNKMIAVNNLQEVINPISLDVGNVVTNDGLFSNTIFGRTKEERSGIYAYIDLKSTFLQPLVYITLRKIMSAKLDSLILGEAFFKLDNKGYLVESVEGDGHTGIKFLYDNWGKIKFEHNTSMVRSDRIKFVTSIEKNVAFVDKWIVIPPLYRDIRFSGDKIVSADVVNDYYSELMRMSKAMSREKGTGITVVLSITRLRMQTKLVELYNYFKNPPNLSKKYGIIKSGLLGKSVDYSARLVISAPLYDEERWDQVPVKFDRCGVPLGALVVLFYPFFQNWLSSYFKREFVDRQKNYPIIFKGESITVELDNPESYFSPDYLDKQLKSFVHSYGDRFREIEVPTLNYGTRKVTLYAKSVSTSGILDKDAKVFNRNMTWTDLLYRAAVDITSDKTVIVTRYPLEDYFGVSGFKVHVLSTNRTIPAIVNDTLYEHYPIVHPDMDQQQVSIQFVNTLIMANCFLPGYGADYDGDQVTVKGNFTKEANDEVRAIAMSKKNFLTIGGNSNRETMNEAMQGIYSFTID
ncbi:MAG: hypothetical protein ACRC0G_07745 [Fusobacteriaceae bacterium]